MTTIDGKVVYLRSNSIFGPAPVEDPVKAEDFTDRPLDLEHLNIISELNKPCC